MKRALIKFIILLIPSKKLRKKLRAKFVGVKKLPFLKNVFKTKYNKNVLFSYITEPFKKITLTHSNMTECYTAAEIFKKLGYNIDVVQFDSDKDIDYAKYDVVYGFGKVLENSFYSSNPNTKRIFYGTGYSVRHTNTEGGKRTEKFNKKYHLKDYISGRFSGFYPLQHYFSDTIISLGNKFSANSYKMEVGNPEIKSIDLFYFKKADLGITNKDFSKARNHFLWFGSMGLIRKGLDLTIEYFQKNPDLTLHICGASPRETGMFQAFKNELENKVPNIINHGFVKIDGDEFKNIMEQCAFTIFPTLAEGSSPSLINNMINGLIPITTEACSLDLKGLGFIIKELNYEGIDEQVKKALKLSDKELEKLSKKVQEDTRKRYTLERYKANLEKIIKEALNEKNFINKDL